MKAWILLLLATPSATASPLLFSARIQEERLAEESIDLLRCLAERLGTGWELSDETTGPRWIRLEEASGRLRGNYELDGRKGNFLLSHGQWREACTQALPASVAEAAVAPAVLPEPEAMAPSSNHRIWLGIGAAAVLSGVFLFWRSRQPEHRSLRLR